MIPIAHRHVDKNGSIFTQPLTEHLYNVAVHAREIGEKINLANVCFCIGLFHDIGKSYAVFQEYITNATNGKVNHSSAGGVYIYEEIRKKPASELEQSPATKLEQKQAEILAYVIFAHHGLFDLLESTDKELGFDRRLGYEKASGYNRTEFLSFVKKHLGPYVFSKEKCKIDTYVKLAQEEMKELFEKINALAARTGTTPEYISISAHYYVAVTMRLLLSILKEADIYDSANAFRIHKDPLVKDEEYKTLWRAGVKAIEKKYLNFGKRTNPSPIDKIRTELANEAKENADKIRAGCLRAELPTGSGKTLLTTRFALNNCKAFEKRRFLYITAFLSVLEQNADEIKGLLENKEYILEHHSNVVMEIDGHDDENQLDDREYYLNQYLIESWESPVVLTTMVQYMNTLFKGKASNIRRFCKLIDSVILLDEVQNLPTCTTHNFNLMNNYLTEIMNATIIHCTATQPDFDSSALKFPVIYTDQCGGYLACLTAEKSKVFDRVRAYYLKKENPINILELRDLIEESSKGNPSILIVANTKKSVHQVYEEIKYLKDQGFKVFELTTKQCAVHRLSKIKMIKSLLNKGQKVIVVSTQLIEAGVDLDFSVVYRSMAGIASLIQTMGRCNREGKREYGLFYLFDFAEENTQSLKEIRMGQEHSLSCLSDMEAGEIDIMALKTHYYHTLYRNAKDMDYPIVGGSNMLDLMSFNMIFRNEYKQSKGEGYPYAFAQNLKQAADGFKLIDDTGISVIVQLSEEFGELGRMNRKLIKDYRNAIVQSEYKDANRIIRQLQRYTISIRRIEEYSAYVEKVGDVYLLLEEYYDYEVGLNTDKLVLLY
ncbi:MAG: CRISPR-associated helicase Cas3' [Tissierellia bacterium]|nr:CRISPR-associated helicase Cas3' [Tissierellia bacterium]